MSSDGIGAGAPLASTVGVPGGGPFGVLADAKVVSSGSGRVSPPQAAHPPEVAVSKPLPAGERMGDGSPLNPCYSTRTDYPHPGPQGPFGGLIRVSPRPPPPSPSELHVTRRLLPVLSLAAAVAVL